MPTSTDGKTFYVGLCMAGAVSAGAYTAGVMDYLIEALQAWQDRKDSNAPNTPRHQVVIPVIGGASAGGMTAIITAAALNNPIKPVYPGGDIMAERPENKLYHTWVDLTNPDMFPLMLNPDDIEKKGILSLLNSAFIDETARRALQVEPSDYPMPAYFDPALKIFTTLTNLEGFPYNISFAANIPADKYYMSIHNDYACFQMNSDEGERDGWMNLDFRKNIHVDIARDAAMATGAFPVGLQSRMLTRTGELVNKMPWCSEITQKFPIPGGNWATLNVDGGLINNEPFEKVRDVLSDKTGQKEEADYQDPAKFKSLVLMIDPFPSAKPAPLDPNLKLSNVVGATFSAMMSQMRAKPEHLQDAMDRGKAGQFLIAPSRRRPNLKGAEEDVAGDKAIACGSFDGFGGFMNKEFRVHDYFLGRFNCEMFLRNYLTIPAAAVEQNEIFKYGYEGIDAGPFKTADGSYPVIPIFSPPPAKDYFPIPTFSGGQNWPVIRDQEVERFRSPVKKRVQSLLVHAIAVSGISKVLLWIGTKVVLNRMISNYAMDTIKKALVKHELLKN